MTTLTVGTDKQYQTVSAAIAASADGDIINVDAGTYTNDFASITTDITLNAVGGMVHMLANVPPTNAKAIFTTDANVTINGFEFSGAAVADQNGAGIKMQTGNLTINDCYFHNNEMGILTGNTGSGSLVIDDSEFAFNGAGSAPGIGHNLYVGQIDNLTVTDSYFHDASVGHEIKSRAETTIITNNRIQDQSGTGSLCIDIPNGGNATITGNVIEQGPFSENSHIMSYGAEGMAYTSNSLVIDNNVILNDKPTNIPFLYNAPSISVQFTNNDVFGLTAAQLPAGTGTTFLTVEPALDTSHPFSVGGIVIPPPTDLILTGGNGRQTLVGGDGNDIFNGGAGKDTITTGPGHDTIIFDQPPIRANRDTVTDFNNLDTAQLSSAVFTNPAFIHYDSGTGALMYLTTTLAKLPTGLTLTGDNFKIV